MLKDILANIYDFMYIIPVVLIALSVHELAHGYVAYLLGDNTAKNMGRLSINPIHHIDPIGMLCLMFIGFGWAKPVPVNAYFFKNRKRDMALTALAGPVSNFIMAFFGAVLLMLIGQIGLFDGIYVYVNSFLITFIRLNVGLGVFNLIPLPPLDGSKILSAVLPEDMYFNMMQYDRYFQMGLMILLFMGYLTRPLAIVRSFVFNGMVFWAATLVGLFF